MEFLSTVSLLELRASVLGGMSGEEDAYLAALRALRYAMVRDLHAEKGEAGKGENTSAHLRLRFQGGHALEVSALVPAWSAPIKIFCGCNPGILNPPCTHAHLLILVLWITLQNAYGFEHLLPSVTDKLREFEKELRFIFPSQSSVTPEDIAARARKLNARFTHLFLHLGNPEPLPPTPGLPESQLEFPETLAPMRVPHRHEFAVLPFVALGAGEQIPEFFAIPPQRRISNLQWGDGKADHLLRMGIQFGFSNGAVVGLGDILFHPLAALVPAELLPLARNLRMEVKQNPHLNPFGELYCDRWGGRDEARQIFISVLLNAGPRIAAGEFEFYLTSGEAPTVSRKGLKLQGFELAESPSFKWSLLPPREPIFGVAELVFTADQNRAPGPCFYQFEINSTTQTLRLHSYGDAIRVMSYALPRMDGSRGFTGRYLLQGHESIQGTLREIDQEFARRSVPPVERPFSEVVSEEAIIPQLWIDDAGAMRFELKVQTKKQGVVSVWNLPHAAGLLVRLLNEGVGAVSHLKNTDIAQDRRGEKRDRDLKILRHSGLASTLFMNCAEYDEKAMTQEQLVSHVSKLWLHLLAQQDENPSALRDKELRQICSKRVMELVGHLIDLLANQLPKHELLVFTPQGELRLQGVLKKVLQVFLALVNATAEQSQGKSLLKTRGNVFDDFFGEAQGSIEGGDPWDLYCEPSFEAGPEPESGKGEIGVQTYHPTNSSRTLKNVLSALVPLTERGFELYYDGRKIESLNETDLRAEFSVSHHKGEELQTGGQLDWFDLHPKVFFKGKEIDPAKLTELASDGVIEFQGQYYLLKKSGLPSLKRLERFWAQLQGGGLGEGVDGARKKSAQTYYRLPRSQTLEILALRASGVVVEGGKEWQEICEFYDSLNTTNTTGGARAFDSLPPSLHVELKPFQKQGVQWLLDLYRLRLGGILADDMGLGKTVQTLVFLEKLRSEGKLGRVLIVVPTSLTYNWVSESKRFTPELPIQIFQAKDKAKILDAQGGVIVATYGLLTEHQEFLTQFGWNILVFDEAQNLKNISAKRTTAARSLKVRFRLCLTGTPLENHLGEFFSLMDLAVPGSLGELAEFQRLYVNPDVIAREDVQYLRLKSKPLLLRRTKNQILLELPAKTESEIKLPFEKKQERIYRDIALSWNEKVKGSISQFGEAKSHLMMLTALLRLRQACSDPSGIPHVKYTETPPKAELLLESLQEITEGGESALVFTQFLATLHRLELMMAAAGIKVFTIHGGTTRVQRERILAEFQASSGGAVLLMTLKTGGVGLNLVKASYVFHLEPWWNPAVENQATDRAHRMGQVRPVQVFRYLILDSVEEKIKVLKARKSAQFDAMFESVETEVALGDQSKSGSGLSQRDFEYLLS